MWKSLRPIIFLLLAGCLIFPFSAHAGEKRPNVYQVELAFIYNLVNFIEWPEGTTSHPESSLCILGENPFGDALHAIPANSSSEKTFLVTKIQSLKEAEACHMLFISASEKAAVSDIVKAVERHGVLTIGDTDGFARQGVIINFFIATDKVRFEINRKAAERAGFKLSSKLLQLARIAEE